MQQPQACNPYATLGKLDDTMGMGFVQPGFGNPLAFRDRFGRGGGGPGAFLDDEIRASFDGLGGVGAGFADPLTPSLVHAAMGADSGCEMEGFPVPRALPVPMAPATNSRIRADSLGYGEVPVGSDMRKTPDTLVRRHSCHTLSGNTSGLIPNGVVSRCFFSGLL